LNALLRPRTFCFVVVFPTKATVHSKKVTMKTRCLLSFSGHSYAQKVKERTLPNIFTERCVPLHAPTNIAIRTIKLGAIFEHLFPAHLQLPGRKRDMFELRNEEQISATRVACTCDLSLKTGDPYSNAITLIIHIQLENIDRSWWFFQMPERLKFLVDSIYPTRVWM
jgi:hypothetical protein